MEPTDLKNELPDDAQLEAWYRAHLATPPLRDDGFSQRVLAALPVPARRSTEKRRLFCLVGALLGTAVAAVRINIVEGRPTDLAALNPEFREALVQLANPAFGLAIVITIFSLWFVFRPKMRFLQWLSQAPVLTGR